MSNDFEQWRHDRELIHFEKEEQGRFNGPGRFRGLRWVLFWVIVLPILVNSCVQ